MANKLIKKTDMDTIYYDKSVKETNTTSLYVSKYSIESYNLI